MAREAPASLWQLQAAVLYQTSTGGVHVQNHVHYGPAPQTGRQGGAMAMMEHKTAHRQHAERAIKGTYDVSAEP
jgi:hypothetical protein